MSPYQPSFCSYKHQRLHRAVSHLNVLHEQCKQDSESNEATKLKRRVLTYRRRQIVGCLIKIIAFLADPQKETNIRFFAGSDPK